MISADTFLQMILYFGFPVMLGCFLRYIKLKPLPVFLMFVIMLVIGFFSFKVIYLMDSFMLIGYFLYDLFFGEVSYINGKEEQTLKGEKKNG